MMDWGIVCSGKQFFDATLSRQCEALQVSHVAQLGSERMNSFASKRVKCSEISFRSALDVCSRVMTGRVDSHQQKTNFSITFLNVFTGFAGAHFLMPTTTIKDFLIIFLRETTFFLNKLIVLVGFDCDCASAHTPVETIVISHCAIFLGCFNCYTGKWHFCIARAFTSPQWKSFGIVSANFPPWFAYATFV